MLITTNNQQFGKSLLFSCIKDTRDFFRKLKPITEVLVNSYLVTLDVKSLYTSIPNFEEIKAVKLFHEHFSKKTIATYSNFKQFCIQLKKLSTNQRLCNGNYLSTILRKYIHGPFHANSRTISRTISLKFTDHFTQIHGPFHANSRTILSENIYFH